MKKTNIFYWIVTILFALVMLSSAIPNIMATKQWEEILKGLGYPLYMLPFLGVAKIIGIIIILIPGFPRLKEWAYAGFGFVMTGAIISHLVLGDSAKELFGPTLLLILTAVSWYFRPADRKIISVNQ